ncbi:hypothetical protein BDZ91DRAFT_529369 [Kalaharituber pfeilii]|nr:hypothetical protein BDZ91DRAFT_529369 [Kalaharituber pfeilii]
MSLSRARLRLGNIRNRKSSTPLFTLPIPCSVSQKPANRVYYKPVPLQLEVILPCSFAHCHRPRSHKIFAHTKLIP